MITFPAVNADSEAELKRAHGVMGSTDKGGAKNIASPPIITNDTIKGINIASPSKAHTEEFSMGTPSREEIDAKVSQSKAEAEVISANMKAENAYHREVLMNRLSAMDSSLSGMQQQAAITNGEIVGMKGQFDGIKFSMTTMQCMMGAIIAMLAVIITLPQIQSYFKVPDAAVTQVQADKKPTDSQGK